MRLNAEQLNKMTLIKALVTFVIIASVMLVCAFSVSTMAGNYAYDSAKNAYIGWVENLAENVKTKAAELNFDYAAIDATSAGGLFSEGYNGFEGVAVIDESGNGRTIYSTGLFSGYLSDHGLSLPAGEAAVEITSEGGKDYAFAVAPVSERYFVAGYIDFTPSVQAVSAMRSDIIIIFVVALVAVIIAFGVFLALTGLNERGHRYRYKFTTDLEGRILRSNAAFKADFPQTLRIYDPVAHFSEENLNAIKLPSFDEEIFISCTAKRTPSGKIKLAADRLSMPYNAQATQPRDMMREAYITMLPHGKPFLIGIIFFADLHNIKDMFGRDFAESVHGILYDKIARRFNYIYELDLYNIGVLFPDGKNYEILLQDLKGLVDDYNQTLKIDNNIVNVSVKCGFAICDNMMEQRGFEYAMTAADAALRRANRDKLRNYYVFHGSEIKQYAKFFFNYDLRQMLNDNMFEMEYQPQYGIKEGRIVGFEALFRVKKNANVFVNIFDLISYAERSGNMVIIGNFIFETAMRFAKRVENKNVTVSLNVSPVQLMQAGFCQNFLEIYDRYDIKPGVLCVEITESFLVQNFDDAVKKLEVLREHGIEIHLDDFGTRYSSLLYLKKLPVQVIKIDREFIIDICENAFDRSITGMIINICREQNLVSISEGVETKEQFEMLKSMGVDIIQGFLIGRSAPADIAYKLIDEFKLKLN